MLKENNINRSALNLLRNAKTVFMHKTLFICLLFFTQTVFAQFHLGVFLGGSSYLGELNDKAFKRTKSSVGLSLNYEVSDRFSLRTGLTFGKLEGADKYSGNDYV